MFFWVFKILYGLSGLSPIKFSIMSLDLVLGNVALNCSIFATFFTLSGVSSLITFTFLYSSFLCSFLEKNPIINICIFFIFSILYNF